MQFKTIFCASLFINIAATAASAQPVAPVASATKADIVPLVDYHVHINSLMYAQRNFPPILPSVQLPPELAHLTREFGKNWNSKTGLAPLFSEDSMIVKRDVNNWVKGKAVVSDIWSQTYGEEITLIPVSYKIDNSAGYIMTYIADAETPPTIFGQAMIALEKEKDGQWRIAGKMMSVGYPRAQKAVTAEDLLAELDAAGIQRANILSAAFVFAGAPELEPGEAARVRAENDWNAQQAARHPTRLTAFCGLNP